MDREEDFKYAMNRLLEADAKVRKLERENRELREEIERIKRKFAK